MREFIENLISDFVLAKPSHFNTLMTNLRPEKNSTAPGTAALESSRKNLNRGSFDFEMP